MTGPGETNFARRLGAEIRTRRVARGMSLRALAKELGLSGHGTLVDYEYGRRVPPEDLVVSCERVFQISDGALRNLREKALAERANQQADLLLNRSEQPSESVQEPVPEPVSRPEPEERPARARWPRRRWLVAAAVAVVVLAGLGIWWWTSSPEPTGAVWTATSGPNCSTGDAFPMDTSGTWTALEGSKSAGCGTALIHEAADDAAGANWIFTPGVGKTCTFRIHIPDSSVVTARNATYQAWETQPGEHEDEYRIGGNVQANQQAHLGGTITLTFGPTRNGTIDLQLYDNHSEHAIEVADTVVASCR